MVVAVIESYSNFGTPDNAPVCSGQVKRDEVADVFGYSVQAVKKIEKNKDIIRTTAAKASASNSKGVLKKKRAGQKLTFPELDEGVFQFVEMARQKRFPVRPNFVLNVATFLALKLGFPTFKASKGWYRAFCSRHEIHFGKLSGTVNPFLLNDHTNTENYFTFLSVL